MRSKALEMGRKSLFMSMGTEIFGIGITSASFHGVGTHACWSEALMIKETGKARI